MSPRPRRDEGDILEATLRVIADDGISGATVDTVAARRRREQGDHLPPLGLTGPADPRRVSSLEGPYVETRG